MHAPLLPQHLPREVLDRILSFVPGVLSYEEAAARRARLMSERKYLERVVTEELFERPFSLCEH